MEVKIDIKKIQILGVIIKMLSLSKRTNQIHGEVNGLKRNNIIDMIEPILTMIRRMIDSIKTRLHIIDLTEIDHIINMIRVK